jgi:hypothetical protein
MSPCLRARIVDPSESGTRITEVKTLLHDVLDNRLQIAVGPLETFLVFRDEALEMMEKHPVEIKKTST